MIIVSSRYISEVVFQSKHLDEHGVFFAVHLDRWGIGK